MFRSGQTRTAIASSLLLVFLVGCGADGELPIDSPSGPSIAPARFGGEFSVAVFTDEGGGEVTEPRGAIVFELDAEFGELRIDAGCGVQLGAFSLMEDGRAGMTIAGGSKRGCSEEAADQQERLLAVVRQVSTWSETDQGLVLTSRSGGRLELRR